MKEKSAAIITIHNAADMSPKGRKDIAKWMDRQKKILLKDHAALGARYTARYLYTDKQAR